MKEKRDYLEGECVAYVYVSVGVSVFVTPCSERVYST